MLKNNKFTFVNVCFQHESNADSEFYTKTNYSAITSKLISALISLYKAIEAL